MLYEVTELTVPPDPVNSMSLSREYSLNGGGSGSHFLLIDFHRPPSSSSALTKENQCPGQGTLGSCVPYLKTQPTVPGLGGEASSCLSPAHLEFLGGKRALSTVLTEVAAENREAQSSFL